MSSRTTVFEKISSKLMEIFQGSNLQFYHWHLITCLCRDFFLFFSFFTFLTTFLGCRLETTWHKMDPVQRESAALIPTSVSDNYMFCPRCFTNLMCIICNSYFIELCPRTLLLHVAVYENTGKSHTVQFVRVPLNHVMGGGYSDRPRTCALINLMGMSPKFWTVSQKCESCL